MGNIYDGLAEKYLLNDKKFDDAKKIVTNLKSKDVFTENPERIQKILEVGPGAGHLAKAIDENVKFKDYLGIEKSKGMYEASKKNNPNLNFENGDILDYKNLGNDLSLLSAVVHLFPDELSTKILNNLYHNLTKDGKIYLSTTLEDKYNQGLKRKKEYNGEERFRVDHTMDSFKELVEKSLDGKDYELIHNVEEGTDFNKIWQNILITKK